MGTRNELETYRYLDRHGVKEMIKKAVAELCIHKPDDPANFLCDFFHSIAIDASAKAQAIELCDDQLEDCDDLLLTDAPPLEQRDSRGRRLAFSDAVSIRYIACFCWSEEQFD